MEKILFSRCDITGLVTWPSNRRNVDMCGVAGKRKTSDRNVTGLHTLPATRHTLCVVGQ